MKNSKCSPLSGANNKRLNNMDLENNQLTSPSADGKCVKKGTHLTIPSEQDVQHAKEWVDDGSLL